MPSTAGGARSARTLDVALCVVGVGQRQLEGEGASVALLLCGAGHQPQAPPQPLDDGAADVQPEAQAGQIARAGELTAKERLIEGPALVVWHPDPAIHHTDSRPAACRTDLHD